MTSLNSEHWTLNTKADVRMRCDNNPLEKLMNRIRHCDNRVEIICIHPQLLESIVTIHNLSNIKIAEMTLQCHKIHTHTHTCPIQLLFKFITRNIDMATRWPLCTKQHKYVLFHHEVLYQMASCTVCVCTLRSQRKF